MQGILAAFCNCNQQLQYGQVDWDSIDYRSQENSNVLFQYTYLQQTISGEPLPSYIEFLYQAVKHGRRVDLSSYPVSFTLAFVERWLRDNGVNRTLRSIARDSFRWNSPLNDFAINGLTWRDVSCRLHTTCRFNSTLEASFRNFAQRFYAGRPDTTALVYFNLDEGYYYRVKVMLQQWRRSRTVDSALQLELAACLDDPIRRLLCPMTRLRTLIKHNRTLTFFNQGAGLECRGVDNRVFFIPELDRFSSTIFKNFHTFSGRRVATRVARR